MTDLRDQLAVDELARIAVHLAARVRDEDPEANGRWLATVLPSPDDWFRLAFILAAAIPVDRSWNQLTGWALLQPGAGSDEDRPRLKRSRHTDVRPCGTAAAARRHRYHGEALCDLCRVTEQARDRERRRIRAGNPTPERRAA
ncbi:hypothetical protein [Actinoplanes sp. NPDC049118]|uniref:hypothetical protein n=1 Tax=Actinoplanes sp. NPDC049118 TaxID=3155769 RepID=UPI0034082064